MSDSQFVISKASGDGDGTTDGGIPDQLKCPICFEVPEAEIYQCKNSHIICHKCKAQPSVRECPQCRVPFEVDGEHLIRNRALENLVTSILMPCPFRHNGCQKNLSLNSVKSHAVNCDHNDKRIQLCKLLGYNCDYWTNPLNGTSTVAHFHSHHKAYLQHSDFVLLKIHNFVESIKEMKTFNAVWKPVILYNDNTAVMILTIFKSDANCVSWVLLNLTPEVSIEPRMGLSSGFDAEFTLKNKDFGYATLRLDLPVVSVLKSAQIIGKPTFGVLTKTLEGWYLDSSEILNVFISLKKGAKVNKETYVYLRKITPINYFINGGTDEQEEKGEGRESFIYPGRTILYEYVHKGFRLK